MVAEETNTAPSGMAAAAPSAPNSTASVWAALTTTQTTTSAPSAAAAGFAAAASAGRGEARDGVRVHVAGRDREAGPQERAGHAGAHGAEADHRGARGSAWCRCSSEDLSAD